MALLADRICFRKPRRELCVNVTRWRNPKAVYVIARRDPRHSQACSHLQSARPGHATWTRLRRDMMETESIPEPAELLLKARKAGVTIQPNGKGGLRLSSSRLITPELFYGCRRVKAQLLALVSKLGAVGATDDPLVLEAVALFNVRPEGISQWLKDTETRARIPFPTPGKPASASQAQNRLPGKAKQEQVSFGWWIN